MGTKLAQYQDLATDGEQLYFTCTTGSFPYALQAYCYNPNTGQATQIGTDLSGNACNMEIAAADGTVVIGYRDLTANSVPKAAIYNGATWNIITLSEQECGMVSVIAEEDGKFWVLPSGGKNPIFSVSKDGTATAYAIPEQLKENVFSSLCQLYNWMENGEKAIEFAKQNLGVQKDRTTCYKAFELLGSAYYLILQYDSARHYLQKSLFTTDYATKAGAYMYLADIAKEQGDLATSLEMERNYSAYLDSMQKSRQPDAIVCAEQGMPSNKQNIISKHTHYSIISISIITLTLIVAVIILSYKKRKQKPNNRTEKEMLYKAGLVLFEQSEVYNKMTLIIRSHKEKAESEIMHQGDWLQLIAETNKCWNNIARELQSKYHLTEDEIYLCCLYLTNLPISHFCHILSCERDTIYKKADRILENKMGFAHKEISLKEALKKNLQSSSQS